MSIGSCGHCGASLEDRFARNPGSVNGVPLCHPNDDGPDCYRLVTLYKQPIGSLIGRRDEWCGVHRVGGAS